PPTSPDAYYRLFVPSTPRHPTPTSFPYTTLFRSRDQRPRLFDDFGTQHHLHRNLYPVGAGDRHPAGHLGPENSPGREKVRREPEDRKSTRLNSSHVSISYAVFCLKKKKQDETRYK